MTLSIVVISRNEGEWLARTLDSLMPTVPVSSEIVVVDDGSEDGSADFVNHPVRVIRSEGIGVARARNLGARHSNGEVIVFADAHLEFARDWWQPLEEMICSRGAALAASAIASTEDRELFGYGFTLASPQLELSWFHRPDVESRQVSLDGPTRASTDPFHAPVLPGACLAMSRRVFEETGGFDEGLRSRGGVDAETGVRFWLSGHECWVVPESRVWHYFRRFPPYPVPFADVMHNRLRLALLHLNRPRIAAVRRAHENHPYFERACRLLEPRELAIRRRALRNRRLHDDSWFFEKFDISW